MIKFSKTCFTFFLVSLLSASSFGQKIVPEFWGQHIHDEAHVLHPDTVEVLEKELKQYEASTTNQIAVLVIQSLAGEAIEEYSLKVVEKWKLGTQSRDNGVLVLIAIDDHKMRIEVGLGLEGVLTDAVCNRIIRNEMAPAFRRGLYDAGMQAAVYSIMLAIGGEYSATPSNAKSLDTMSANAKFIAASCVFIFLGIFAGLGLFSKGCMGWAMYVFMMPFYALFLGIQFSWWILVGYIIAYPVLRLWVMKSKRDALEWQLTTGGSRSGSSGGFSGGGSFGGGGSSGGW